MKPEEAFDHALYVGVLLDGGRRYKPVPGAVISSMTQGQREALSHLTSDTVNNVREEDIKAIVPPITLWEKIARRR